MEFNEIRSRFVNYYTECGFELLPRAPMMHPSIPMSFVMSAGLVQVETSLANAQNRSGNKFVLVQDCFRHFDLDAVGTDDIHLSLFEMPGAFVFGNNGKQDTIKNMWQLATKRLGIDPNRIWASYFAGGTIGDQQLPEDKLARQTWLDLGLPDSRVIGLGIDHNYWVQGGGIQTNGKELRKCGPNTELFFDRGKQLSCGTTCQPGCRCGRFIEFANSLFISYKLHPETDILILMDDPFNETVIGTERVAMILQDVDSVFDTKNYRLIIDVIHQFANCKNLPRNLIITSERVIADYLRALFVLVADGAPPPGKNGRERIVKLLVRGVLTRQIILGIKPQDFFSLIIASTRKIFVNSNLDALQIERKLYAYFENESRRFLKTVEHGRREMELLLTKNQGKTLSELQILSLEKKRGLPHLLTDMILREKGLIFAEKGYNQALAMWRQGAHS